MLKYIDSFKIRNHYTDIRGRLVVKVLCDLFNDLANEQTLDLHFDVGTLNAQGLTWMLHKLHIVFHRVPRKEESITLETWPSGIDRLFALRDFKMLSSEGEVLIEATSEWMVIDMERRRPVRLPAVVLEVAGKCGEVKQSLKFDLDTKAMPLMLERERHFVATYDNIDFNKHVTQATYVGWVVNSLAFDFLKEHEIEELEIVYEHEIMPDSDVLSTYGIVEHVNEVDVYHRIMNMSKAKTHCLARTKWKKVSE